MEYKQNSKVNNKKIKIRKMKKLFKKRESKRRSQAFMKIEIKTRTKIKVFIMRRECSLILKKICIYIIIISVCGELDFLFFFLFQFFFSSFSSYFDSFFPLFLLISILFFLFFLLFQFFFPSFSILINIISLPFA